MPTGRSVLPRLERTVLGNGLRVIVAPDRSSPLVNVAMLYDVGFRSEPEGRTGFAHLFEHLMFQGSANVDKIEHIRLVQSAGGLVNGHTLPDLTAWAAKRRAVRSRLGERFLERCRGANCASCVRLGPCASYAAGKSVTELSSFATHR